MAGSTHGQTYGNRPSGSIAEDVTDIIYQITPEDTPFFEITGTTGARDVVHQWQIRSLTTRQVNKKAEGDAFSFASANRLPTRLDNLTQISKQEIRVTRTHQQVSHYAIDDLFGDQMEVAMIEHKTDIEHCLIACTKASGATGTARELGGILQFIEANASNTFSNYYPGGAAGGFTLTENAFNYFLQLAWDQGSRPRDCFVGGPLKRTISGFTASSTKYISADEQRAVNTISIYESDFGDVQMHLCRDMPSLTLSKVHDLLLLDRTMAAKAWLGPVEAMRTPKVADSEDGVVISEYTLEVGNPDAHVYAKQLTPNVTNI